MGPEEDRVLVIALAWPSAAAPVEVQVPDPRVIALVLDCGGDTTKALVERGVAVFPEVPKSSCTVQMIRTSGTIDAPGTWTCTLDACRLVEVHHREVTDASGRVNVVAADLPPASSLEVNCPSGYRARQPVVDNTATFDGVPREECTLHFKGGMPAKYHPLRWGTWACHLSDTVAVCTQGSAPPEK